MTMPTGDPELDEFRRKQEEEYGQWVATQNIYVGNALAYLEGGQVPASNVERLSYEKMGLVEPREAYEKRQKDKVITDDERNTEVARASAEAQGDAPQADDGTAADSGSKPAKRTRAKSTSDGE